jgi:hypothetical protein
MPLATALKGMPELSQTRWHAWVRKQKLDGRLPAELGSVLTAVGEFADPAITGDSKSLTWSPAALAWCEE